MRNIFAIIILFFITTSLHAQDIEVKKLVLLEKDKTALSDYRKDINGNICGLVKVQLKEPGAEFEGNVMGNVQFTGNEYLVYLPNGTKRLGIKHPDYLPTTIVFADYGTKKVASSTTYELKVKTNKKKAKVDNSKKGMAVFNIKPSNAMLLIDGQIADGSGGAYMLSLPYGTHYYTVKLKDFAMTNQSVKIDKEAKTIDVDLTEYFARIDVSCTTKDAEIRVNGEQKGIEKWGGMVAPGKYDVEVSKEGCHSQGRQIVLQDNDTLSVNFPALKTITGSLRVDYEPAGADVLLNGKKVGLTPLVLKDIPVGDYNLEVWKEYYVKKFSNVKIREDQEWTEKGKLELTKFGELYLNANDSINNLWYTSSMKDLAEYYRYGAYKTRNDVEYCGADSVHVPFNPVKSIALYRRVFNADKLYCIEWFEEINAIAKNDEQLSFMMVFKEIADYDANKDAHWRMNNPYPTLAWHYFYGVGCEKNVEEAKQIMRRFYEEVYLTWGLFSSHLEMIRDMGLEAELTNKYEHLWQKKLNQ